MPNIVINVPAQSTPEKTLGRKLRVIRIASGLTQEAIAEAIGISGRTARRIEGGEALDALVVSRWIVYCGQSLDNVFKTKE